MTDSVYSQTISTYGQCLRTYNQSGNGPSYKYTSSGLSFITLPSKLTNGALSLSTTIYSTIDCSGPPLVTDVVNFNMYLLNNCTAYTAPNDNKPSFWLMATQSDTGKYYC